MNNFLKQKYAMSDQGAKNPKKSIFSHTILNLTKMFPPIVGFMFLFQYPGGLRVFHTGRTDPCELYCHHRRDVIGDVYRGKVGPCAP